VSRQLVWGIVALVLFIVLLAPAEHNLLRVTKRRLDRKRRVIRAFLFLAGVGAWAYVSYLRMYSSSSGWWFISFLIVAGIWKLIVDVLIFGVSERAHSSKLE
jgi:hypothetical protein